MANKTTANFIGVSDDYSGTSGAWSITEARERRASATHGENWGVSGAFDVNFLVIAGGGGSGSATGATSEGENNVAVGGGGAGGYLNSFGSESSGGNTSGLAAKRCDPDTNFTVTVGAGGAVVTNGSNSVFSGTDANSSAFSLTAIGGGKGGGSAAAGNGGSGGGGGSNWLKQSTTATSVSPGTGTTNQGTDGAAVSGAIIPRDTSLCNSTTNKFWCDDGSTLAGGGGGGAGGAPSGSTGGAGLASSITGSSVTRAGGGGGTTANGAEGSNGTGQSAAGGGGHNTGSGQNGTVILRYPNTLTISFSASALTGSTATDGSDKVTTFTAGSGTVSWSYT
jgi:hypothetical protein|tara:strand:+ start:1093 stop:2103 length:1011 start_codon:yes stop_codon:yes gene_type:complete